MTDEVLLHRHGAVGHISLNRPKALHALTQAMCEAMSAQLLAWRAQSGAPPIPMRGRTLGRGYRSGTITPGSNTVIEQTFLSGQKASIALAAADGKVLGLSVLDAKDQPVCREQSQRTSCSWVPLFTQRHTIRLRNPGPGEVRYYLVID